jgi:hypothetical protein
VVVSVGYVLAYLYDGDVDDRFYLEECRPEQVAGTLQPSIRVSEIERSRRKHPQDLGAYNYAMRAMPHVWVLEKDESATALELLGKSLEIDPDYGATLTRPTMYPACDRTVPSGRTIYCNIPRRLARRCLAGVP